MARSFTLSSTALLCLICIPCNGYVNVHRSFLFGSPSSALFVARVKSGNKFSNPLMSSFSSSLVSSVQPRRDLIPLPSSVNGTLDYSQLLRDLGTLKSRLDKLEKTVLVIAPTSGQGTKTKTSVEGFLDAITAPTIAINAKTVEFFSILTFFFIGAIIGRSLLDRLWLLGGVVTAWWASGACKQDTRNGVFVRRLGAQVAMIAQELQEKYNQAIIFYRTGKLAYVSSKTWEKYDQQLQLTQRFNAVKKLAMERASSFNTAVSDKNFYTPLKDIWTVAVTKPTKEINRKYKVTSTISKVSSELYSQSKNTVKRLLFLDEERLSKKKLSTAKPYKSTYYPFGSSASKRKGRDDDVGVSDIIANFFRRISISIKNALNILMDREPVEFEKPQRDMWNMWNLPTAPKPPKKFTLWEKLIAGIFLLCIFEGSKKFLRVALKTLLA